ncbi:unnamed protein product [Arctia plantaginis]|uniref:Uncharacterized protein n=1 Tax=Arctia plantaginis TaxID=874455 RepID=A0A8S1AZ33_ARCPL|nr:unnamed protein product [Arctia plantaginis]
MPFDVASAECERAWRSQPARADGCDTTDAADAAGALSAADMDALISSSQPAAADDLLLRASGSARAPLVRRMTRLWLRAEPSRALHALGLALRRRGYVWRRLHPHLVSLSPATPHRRLEIALTSRSCPQLAIECGAELHMRACALRYGAGGTLLEFRRSRGCGLQFKRRFVELREALRPLEAPPPDDDDAVALS